MSNKPAALESLSVLAESLAGRLKRLTMHKDHRRGTFYSKRQQNEYDSPALLLKELLTDLRNYQHLQSPRTK